MQSFSTIGLRALAPANKGVKKEIAVFREIPIVDGVLKPFSGRCLSVMALLSRFPGDTNR
jgi:hypothetical protein